MVVALEGGYNLLNVGSGSAAIARVLLESASMPSDACCEHSLFEHDAGVHAGTMSAINDTCRLHAPWWPILREASAETAQCSDASS